MRPRKTQRKVVPPPPDVEALIARLKEASDEDIPSILRPLQIWCYPRGDMHSWVDITKKFIGILTCLRDAYGLGGGSKTACKIQLNAFTPKDKELILEILRFIRLLMENSTSRKLFDGYDVINDLLLTTDLDVLQAALYVLLRPLQQYSTQMPTSPELGYSIRARLLALTRGWDRLTLANCSLVEYASSSEPIELPDAAATLQIQFYQTPDPAAVPACSDPVKPTAPSNPLETPTRPTLASARSEQRMAVTPTAKAIAPAVDSSSVTVDLGNVVNTMGDDYLDRLAQTIEENRMEADDQLGALNRVRVVLLTDDLKTRRKLLSNRLLALACYLSFANENEVSAEVFLREPELVNEVADLLVPDDSVGDDVVASAILALDAASHDRPDVLSSINAHVSHGRVMSLLRSVAAKLVANEPVAHDTVDALMGLLAFINSLPSNGNQLIGAGLLPALLEMLDTKGERRAQYIPRACGLIESAYFTHQQALQAFMNADGLNALVGRIKAEVQMVAEAPLPEDTELFNRDSLIAYNTSPVKAELRSIYRMLQSTGGAEGFRNVVDTDLPKSLKRIMTNSDKFGTRNFSLAINIMATIVHNEPTSLGILQEAQLPQTLYEVLEEKMPDAFEVVYTLPNAIGAICLNAAGLEDTIKHFRVVENIIRVAITWNPDDFVERDTVHTIAQAIDELVRHHPTLRPHVRAAIVGLLKEAIEEGNAFKPTAKEVNDYAVDPNDVAPDMEVDKDIKDDQDKDNDKELITNPPLAKLTNVLKLFSVLLRNNNMCKEFIREDNGLGLLLSIAKLPCIPVRFSGTEIAVALPSAMRTISDHDQMLLSETLVSCIQRELAEIPELWKNGADCHSAWLSMTKTEDGTAADYALLRRVAALVFLFSTLTDYLSVSMSQSRAITQLIKAFGVTSGSTFMTDVGQLHRQCFIEHVLFKEVDTEEEKPAMSTNETEDSPRAEGSEPSAAAVEAAADAAPAEAAAQTSAPSVEFQALDKRPPTRVVTVKTIVTRMHAILTRFFKSAIRLIFNKRLPEPAHKTEATALANCIAEILIGHLKASAQVPQKQYAIDTVALGLTTILLFDERGADGSLCTTLFIPFDQKGGMGVMLDNVRRLIHGMDKFPTTSAEEQTQQQKDKVAQLVQGMRIATSVLSAYASPRSLVGSSQTHAIRQREQSLPVNQRFDPFNTFIRIRRDLLPVVQKVFMAEWLPHLPLHIMRTAISTLFEILAGKDEEMEVTIAVPEPASPLIREILQPRPPPTANPASVNQLVEMGFARRAAERALIRSRNNIASAADLLISMPHLFPEEPEAAAPAQAAEGGPAVEDADAPVPPSTGDAPVAEPAPTYVQPPGDDAPATATSGNQEEGSMEVDETDQAPSPTTMWEGQREELDKLRAVVKKDVKGRSIQLLDANEELVHDVLPAFGLGLGGITSILGCLDEAVKESPQRPAALSSRLRLLAVFARSKGPIELPADQCQHLKSVLEDLLSPNEPRPAFLASYLVAAESLLLMSTTIAETKLGDDAQQDIVKRVDLGNLPEFLVALCQSTLASDELSREEVMGSLRLAVILTRQRRDWVTTELLQHIVKHFKKPDSKVTGSYGYFTMLTRHAFDSKSSMQDRMRREVIEWMTAPRNKVTDVQHFVRQLRQMMYRDPNTFLDAVQEDTALVDPGPASSVYHLRGKDDSKDKASDADDESTDKDKKQTVSAAADPFVKSAFDSFENSPTMDFLVSELGATIQIVHQEEASRRAGTPYSESATQAYTYIAFLLAQLVELTGSYMSAKTSFMAAVRQGTVYGTGKGKAGFSAVLTDLVCGVTLSDVQESGGRETHDVRRVAVSSWATSLITSLCASVTYTPNGNHVPDDLVTVRKIVLDGIAKSLKDSTSPHLDANIRYGRLWALGQLIRRLLSQRTGVIPKPNDKTCLQLAKGMVEKNFVGLMTTTLSDIDLNYPNVSNVLESLLEALEHLTRVSNKWGKTENKPATGEEVGDNDESESSTPSEDEDDVSMAMSEAEEADPPDLYRNSALGILGGDFDVDDEDDDMDDDMEEDDDLMEVYDDEMDHDMDDDVDTDPSSDEDDDDDIDGHGSVMEGDWTTDDEEEGDEIDDEQADHVIDIGDGLEEVDVDDEAGVPWDDDDGHMDDEDGEGFDSEDEEGFMHADHFGGVDFDAEEEGMDDFDDEGGYDEIDMDPLGASHPAGGPSLGDGGGFWGWTEPARPSDGSSGRHRPLVDMDAAASSLFGFSSRNARTDNSQHPLLTQVRQQTALRPNNPFGPLSSLTELLASIETFAGQQAVAFVENILQRNRNHGAERIRVDLAHRQDGSFGLSIGGQSFTVPPPTRQLPNTAEEIQCEFEPRPTINRWQEEMALFPYTSQEQISRVVLHIINRLLPAAREASARDTERLRKEEEEEAERLRKEEEEAAAEAVKQREEEQAQAALVSLPESRPQTSQGSAVDIDEDIDMASDAGDSDVEDEDGDEEEEGLPEDSNRVTVTIHGREVDITDTGIDLEFLQALPESLRAEVVEHHLRERNLLMPGEAANVPESSSHIHSDFLDALPPDIRSEILQQETAEQSRRQRPPVDQSTTEPEAGGSGGIAPGTIRDLETEIRGTLRGDDLRDMLAHTIGLPPGLTRETTPKKLTGTTAATAERKPLQLLDKPGIWALLRLLFVRTPLREDYLFQTLVHLCQNVETRTELLNTLLSLVQDGTGDLPAVDRSFQQMSLRGLTATPKTHPTPSGKVAETPGAITTSLFADLQPEHVPTFIAQRCFNALQYIVHHNRQAVSYFLTEHELLVGLKKHSKKGKGKEKFLPQKQFPIVVLMSLLDRTELLKAPGMIESLTTLLATLTKPLTALQNWRNRVEKELSKPDKPAESEEQPTATASGTDAAPVAGINPSVEGTKAIEWKMERPMFPPAILRLVINGLTIGDQTSKTFSSTLMVMQHLSSIPDAKEVLVQELYTRSEQLGIVILGELEKLGKVLEDEKHEPNSMGMIDFSAHSSSQTQLLRLLKTIDYLHSPKSTSGRADDPAAARELYQSFGFGSLWKQLGDCLTLAEDRGITDQISSMLLPLVESLMVVCKYTRPPGELNPADMVSPVLSPTMAAQSSDLFLSFTTAHRKVLNSIVRSNPALLSGSFSLLVQNPRVLEFDNKRSWFFQRLKPKREQQAFHPLQLNVRRRYVFQDSFQALLHRSGDEVKYGKINVKFINEDGVDAGGVTREWYHVLAQQIFDADYALFEPCAADNQTYQPNKHSSINPDHLSYFKFVGRVIGKAIYDGRLLDAYFNRAFYKQILGRACDIRDLEAIDPEYHKSLQWMLENDITDVIDQEFTIEDESFGAKQIVELKPGGASIPVTEANKEEYVRLVCAYRLENSVKEQMAAFLTGFYEMIPRELVQIFEPEQLELLISGVNTFDVDELKNSTQMTGWKSTDVEVSWFWRALRSFSQEERARFLIFVTASSRVPLGGFEKLQGASGTQPFQIQRLYGKVGILPQASTCFNLLLLPQYESYEQLRERLLFAVTETEGFDGSSSNQPDDSIPMAREASDAVSKIHSTGPYVTSSSQPDESTPTASEASGSMSEIHSTGLSVDPTAAIVKELAELGNAINNMTTELQKLRSKVDAAASTLPKAVATGVVWAQATQAAQADSRHLP
ncbi:hypothetical protein CspeluHIS016_0603390 [Cutaneotrichosporon spelunceum]|uniref:HECT-type E3 ubiquitin transferase n=1 Tax=Cutaneotrichosporon spelunceum TaxID=1672016 RepID=A0AAD3YEE5_9TREE|nr:hypothetical protein CspeluHIS016_0603390 [Cutaneotrichosporon spelunceum]